MEVETPSGAGARAGTEQEIPWREIAQSPEFARLLAMRRKITFWLLGVFVVAFGTFLICCAYARPFMRRSVDGGLTVAYVWLLSLTVLAWILVWIYLRLSEGPLARLAQRAVEQHSDGARRSDRSTG